MDVTHQGSQDMVWVSLVIERSYIYSSFVNLVQYAISYE